MRITEADIDDVARLARLLYLMAEDEQRAHENVETFTNDLAHWWAPHQRSHSAFVARLDGPEIVGMAWIALVPRVPRPGSMNRTSADIQSVFVMPEHRGKGIGSALIQAAIEHAIRLGSIRVTVRSGVSATPLYERLGFASSPQLLQTPPD